MPRVSIVMPCFDAGAWLDEALASARGQTMGDFELIVVDDGSTDPETRARLARAADERTRVIATAHAGVVAARNRGAAEAQGGYLCFFDADDRMRPSFLAETCARLDADPGLAFASVWVRLFGDEAWDWTPERCDFPSLLCDCTVATAALVRREAFAAAGGFDPAMELGHEDWDLWLAIVAAGGRGAIVREILFDYRRRAGSRSQVADEAAVYVELFAARARKHAAAYRAHAGAVLAEQERTIAAHLDELASASDRGPELAARRAEVASLRRALGEKSRGRDESRDALADGAALPRGLGDNAALPRAPDGAQLPRAVAGGAAPSADGPLRDAAARRLRDRPRALDDSRDPLDLVVAKERELRELRATLLAARAERALVDRELTALGDEAARLRDTLGARAR